MKKGEECIGVVVRTEFPNKGIVELEDRKIIARDGNYYKANVIVISSECSDEIERAVSKYHDKIADKIETYILENIAEYRKTGFVGCDFSENTLRWQLLVQILRMINQQNILQKQKLLQFQRHILL